jgi:DNA-binding MarR family transcriptional regulator
MRLGALADVVGTTDATASRNVDVLEALDLVERVPDDADGRGVLVAATPAGRATVRERRARLAALVGQLIERLGPEDGPRFAELLTELRAVLAHAGRAPVSSGG